MRTLLLLPALALLAACSTSGPTITDPPIDTTGTAPQWELTFSEDFDGDTLDRSRWFIREHWPFINNELGYYRFANSRVRDGMLRIRSDAERTRGPWNWHDYTTGWVQTIFSQKYGRWEVRARMPRGQGIHSGIWMCPADSSYPPEIDIVEILGHTPTWARFHSHWLDTTTNERAETGTFHIGDDYTKDFHTFAIEWDSMSVKWFVDDVWRFTSTRYVSQTPMFLIISTAVGGNWPGSPDSTTVFPAYHEVDWVRVYRRRN